MQFQPITRAIAQQEHNAPEGKTHAQRAGTTTPLARIRRRLQGSGVVLPVLVLLLRERGLDLATVGALLAVYSLVTVALELPTGGLADAVGRRPVLVVAGVLTVMGSLLLAAGTRSRRPDLRVHAGPSSPSLRRWRRPLGRADRLSRR